jgi:hypothetical protein
MRVLVLYDFDSNKPKKLPVRAGDIVEVVENKGNWLVGRLSDGREGSFPANFATELSKVTKVIALFDFDAQKDQQLSFKESKWLDIYIYISSFGCVVFVFTLNKRNTHHKLPKTISFFT